MVRSSLPEMQPKDSEPTVDLYGTTPEAELDEYDLDDADSEEN